MDEEMVTGVGHDRKLHEPPRVVRSHAHEVGRHAAALLPDLAKRLARSWGPCVPTTVRRQQKEVVIAQQDPDTTAGAGGLLLQRYDQIDHPDSVRAVIDQIAHEPERAVRAGPGVVGVDQLRDAQEIAQFVELAVDIPNHVDSVHWPHSPVGRDHSS